jgi:hypothetical protein
MVPVGMWQWQYWQSCETMDFVLNFCKKNGSGSGKVEKSGNVGMTGGSGWVGVVSFERGDQCGSNGTG